MKKRRLRIANGKMRKKGNTPYKWYNPDKRTYTERIVDFTEPLPEADQAHLDSISEEVK